MENPRLLSTSFHQTVRNPRHSRHGPSSRPPAPWSQEGGLAEATGPAPRMRQERGCDSASYEPTATPAVCWTDSSEDAAEWMTPLIRPDDRAIFPRNPDSCQATHPHCRRGDRLTHNRFSTSVAEKKDRPRSPVVLFRYLGLSPGPALRPVDLRTPFPPQPGRRNPPRLLYPSGGGRIPETLFRRDFPRLRTNRSPGSIGQNPAHRPLGTSAEARNRRAERSAPRRARGK